MFRQIRWRIAFPYLILIVLSMGSLAVYLSNLTRKAYLADLETQLTQEAQLVAEAVQSSLIQGQPGEAIDALARRYASLLGARLTLIAPDGTVLGESEEDRTQMDNHLYRTEVQGALATGQGSSVRFSRTVGYNMMYVAVLIKAEGRVIGIARLALPLGEIEARMARLRWSLAAVTLLMAGIAALMAVLIAERTAQPVRALAGVFKRVADGDLSARVLPSAQDEIGALTRTFNQMADRLREVITALSSERNRLAAVLEHMADGALITDGDGYVRLINPAASRLLATTEGATLGHSFAQVARHYRLIEVWQQCRERGEEQIALVEMNRRGPFLQVIVTPLRDTEARACLVILQDLTQVRRLETVRRDFVSNISHELRTPLASLKAAVDTLRDGALEDPAARRFLDRIEVEVDTLTQMVEELLELSRIESGQVPFRLAPIAIADIVLPAVERLRPQAERANLTLTLDLPSGLPPVLADGQRMQQVVANLVHNAIKFTPAGGEVTLSAVADGDEVVVSVHDTGIGISADALPRIFERFYKVDRARAGAGTGLGLAIAKHIVQGHGGRIWAESTEGRGSTFYFTLPVVANTAPRTS